MADLSRYVRQMRFPPLDVAGQQRLLTSRALICGCGALGSMLASTLARAGVGFLRLVDRDFVELNNLQRQVLYDESDVAAGIPKAVAAQAKLRQINSEIQIEAVVAHVDSNNIERLAADVDILLDGTDNFQTRYLLNDAAVRWGKPWVYGGCLAAEGQSMTILPGETACLSCLMPEAPEVGSTPTCGTAGILGPVVSLIASIQAMEAIKILSGNRQAISRNLTIVDLWDNRLRQMDLTYLRDQTDCPTCRQREFPWLQGRKGSHAAVLCGRNAVQISPPAGEPISLAMLAHKLAALGQVTRNSYLLRLAIDKYQLTVFSDGRAIIGGTDDLALAQAVYDRYIGS